MSVLDNPHWREVHRQAVLKAARRQLEELTSWNKRRALAVFLYLAWSEGKSPFSLYVLWGWLLLTAARRQWSREDAE